MQSGRAFSHFAAATKSSVIFGRSTLRNESAALLVVARIAADAGQPVGREGDEVAVPSRRATSSMYGFSPRFSWTTSTPGSFFCGFAPGERGSP